VADGTRIQAWDCTGAANQQFTLDGQDQLIAAHSNKCVDATTGVNGTLLTQQTCNGTPSQKWTSNANGSFRSVSSGRCMDVSAFGTTNGTAVQTWDCTGANNQQWDQGTAPAPAPTPAPAPFPGINIPPIPSIDPFGGGFGI
jgi:hypothetical protein